MSEHRTEIVGDTTNGIWAYCHDCPWMSDVRTPHEGAGWWSNTVRAATEHHMTNENQP